MAIGMRGLWAVLKGVWGLIGEKNMNLIASGIGFYGILAIFPTIAALVALWGFVADPALVTAQVSSFTKLLPDEVATILTTRVAEQVAGNRTTLGWAGVISVALALWSSRAGVSALVVGLNAVYGGPHRGALRHLLVAFSLTGSLVLLALACFAALVVAPIVLAFLQLGVFGGFIAEALRWSVAISTALLGLGLLYRYAPNRRGQERASWLTPGAVAATILWALATWGFSLYLQNFASYNKIYGSLGAVIVLLLWLYISAFVCLLGAALNAMLEQQLHKKAQSAPSEAINQHSAVTVDHLSHDSARDL